MYAIALLIACWNSMTYARRSQKCLRSNAEDESLFSTLRPEHARELARLLYAIPGYPSSSANALHRGSARPKRRIASQAQLVTERTDSTETEARTKPYFLLKDPKYMMRRAPDGRRSALIEPRERRPTERLGQRDSENSRHRPSERRPGGGFAEAGGRPGGRAGTPGGRFSEPAGGRPGRPGGKPSGQRRGREFPGRIDDDKDKKRRLGSNGRRAGRFDIDDNERKPRMDKRTRKREKLRKEQEALDNLGPPEVFLDERIAVLELSQALRVSAVEIIKELMTKGLMVSATQTIEAELAEEIALKYDAIVKHAGGEQREPEEEEASDPEDDDDSLVPRPPIVTIMGHVDHGKTTLLDAMRKTKIAVADGEAGGITQHIGAYSVEAPDGSRITFVDTPGHAAFNAMRVRGADITDIVVLVVAADDAVQPQTLESICAANEARKRIVVAITKADKANADPGKIKRELLEQSIVLEEFGGDIQASLVSAVTGDGLEDLFEQISLQADVLELKAKNDCPAAGVVIEASKTAQAGARVTVIVQRGTLEVGNIVVAGSEYGTIRKIESDDGHTLETATPSMAVALVGFGGAPLAGDDMQVVASKAEAVKLCKSRQKEQRFASLGQSTDDDGLPITTLDFIVKADVQGSAQAVAQAVGELEAKDDKVHITSRVLRFSAGPVLREDIDQAAVSQPHAVVISFGAPLPADTEKYAHDRNVTIKDFRIIYDAVDDAQKMLDSLVRPPPSKTLGVLVGKFVVQQIFKIAAVGKVAGCKVLSGFVRVGSNIRIIRGNDVVYEGKLRTLRSVKDEVDQVDAPNECGISFDDYAGMDPDDLVEVYASDDGPDE